MKILFATPYRIWDMGRFCESAMIKLGHEVKIFDYRNEVNIFHIDMLKQIPWIREKGIQRANQKLLMVVREYKPDVFLALKGELILPETIRTIRKKYKMPAILWFGDDPHLFHTISSRIAPAYDFVFTSSADAIKWYNELGVEKVEWIGFACDPELHRSVTLKDEEKKKYGGDIGFVGTYYKEREILATFADMDIRIYGPGWTTADNFKEKFSGIYGGNGLFLEEMVKFYNSRKIILNIHPGQQKHGGLKATFRVFEVTGCGAFLITDQPKGIEELFEIGKEIVCYNSIDELRELINYYLQNPKEREEIALRGQKRAYRDHTFEHRMKQILSVL